MTKHMDDRTRASHPGDVRLSPVRLARVEPELLQDGTFKCSPLCPIDHPAAEMRERATEHLLHGDTNPALVVSTAPLVVGAYSVDLDAVALLRFPEELVELHSLEVGSRLLAVNIYWDFRSPSGTMLYAVDLVPGPLRSGWSNFTPYIADFLTDDGERVERRKREFSEAEWALVADRVQTRIARLGLTSARSGKPTRAGFPVRDASVAPYGPLDDSGVVSSMPMAPSGGSSNRVAILIVMLVLATVWLLLLRR